MFIEIYFFLLLFKGQAECVVLWCCLDPHLQVLPLMRVRVPSLSSATPMTCLAAVTRLGSSSLSPSSSLSLSVCVWDCLPFYPFLPCLLLLCSGHLHLNSDLFGVCSPLFYFHHAFFNFSLWWKVWLATEVCHTGRLSIGKTCHGLHSTTSCSLGKTHNLSKSCSVIEKKLPVQ